jgi:hypothetical protein
MNVSGPKRFFRWILLCLVIFGSIGFVGSFVVSRLSDSTQLFDDRTISYCVEYLQKSPKIEEEFGEINSVRVTRYSAKRMLSSDGTSSGRYQFSIDGTSKSGNVMVYWKTDENDSIQVERIQPG